MVDGIYCVIYCICLITCINYLQITLGLWSANLPLADLAVRYNKKAVSGHIFYVQKLPFRLFLCGNKFITILLIYYSITLFTRHATCYASSIALPISCLIYLFSNCTHSVASYAFARASFKVSAVAVIPSTRPPFVTISPFSSNFVPAWKQ